MIASFRDQRTGDLYHGRSTNRTRRIPPDVRDGAVRKLDMIQAAIEMTDLRSPPGNRLEALRGDLKGFFSIRVNDQWRIIFRWEGREAHDVELIDYH
ncbi:MAG: type II toxin-antitoxin system RelE/ParE family toxin [Xanthomonadales bacterium]|jgi:proteic killer suppression protein|nr:type II toxin-antitoxin system RelE/ParE family toxin [Xanthomonadales bacterium]